MTDPAVMPGLAPQIDAAPEVLSLRRQLQREQEARRLAEQLAGQGIDAVLREQRELMLLGRVAVAANEATSLNSAIEECLSLVARHAGWPVATMWIRNAEDHHLHPTGSWFRESASQFESLTEAVASRLTVPSGSLPGVVATSGAPQWLDGLQFKSNWLRGERDDELGVATAVAVPVWAGRDVVGVVALFHDEKMPRCNRLLELTEQVVTQLGVAVHRFNEVDALRAAPLALEFDPAHAPGADVAAPRPSEDATAQLAELAHEVRTPLHGIIGNLELLGESGLDSEQQDISALALRSAHDLHQRLEAWLDNL